MHVLAGKYKNQRLQSSLSPKVKPTVRRLREALFNYLGDQIEGARFLDLCAGSGSVGIEALSRGAGHATFVERSVKFCHFIMTNLDTCAVDEAEADVVADDAVLFLERAHADETLAWDIIFYDPPYGIDYGPVLALIGAGAGLAMDSLLVVEHVTDLELPAAIGSISIIDAMEFGDSCLTVFAPRLNQIG
ncbi:MAG: 16S rRNA (guanine(966)-N(2))-methyltransferase RsmD [Pyrinomonadaceae bacterium]